MALLLAWGKQSHPFTMLLCELERQHRGLKSSPVMAQTDEKSSSFEQSLKKNLPQLTPLADPNVSLSSLLRHFSAFSKSFLL